MSEFTITNPYKSDHQGPIRWIYTHLRRNLYLVPIMLVGAVGNALLAALMPVFLGIAFDAALETPANFTTIGQMAIAIIISQIVRAVLQFGRNFGSELLGRRLERDAREELYLNLLGKSMTFHDFQPVGDVMARATNDVYEMYLMISPGVNLVIGSTGFMLMPLILAPRYDWALTFAPLFFIVTYVLALIRYLGILNPIADRVRLAFGGLNSRLAEAIDGIEVVKSTAQEAQEIERFRVNAAEYREAVVAQGRVEARFLPLLLLGVATAIGFAHALILFEAGRIAVGDVIAYVGLLSLFRFPTFISLTAYSQVSRGLAGARRILELLRIETSLDQNERGFSGDCAGRISFEDVHFSYVDGTLVLENITFNVEPGQTIAIVGQTGAGKSTIAKLINRTYDVQSGRVLINGIDVRDWNLASLRQQISIIEQDIFLFSRTIAENIAFGSPDATPAQIEAAARAAQAHEFIMGFEDGYETVIGERGVTLSGGQRQRLALARAFLVQPRILILDDSTSAVDSATEDKIQQAITAAAAQQTTILITHRLSQIRWADQVLLLRQGRLVAAGNHDDLMRSYAAYRRIFEQYEGQQDSP